MKQDSLEAGSDGKSRKFCVGLTGGIASGKTTVSDLFADLGVDIVDTDVIARQVVEPGQPALEAISATFGDGILNSDGSLDRGALRDIVFADDTKRQVLEDILHPRIRECARLQGAQATSAYYIVVVPLLAESPMRHDVDRVLVVDCSEQTQLRRLLDRDRDSKEQALRMIRAQATRKERLAIADDVIVNDDSLESLRSQVHALHARYLSLSGD